MIRTVDIDVLCLAVAAASTLSLQELWLAFSTGKHLCYIPAHEIAVHLGPERAEALQLFHAFTGYCFRL